MPSGFSFLLEAAVLREYTVFDPCVDADGRDCFSTKLSHVLFVWNLLERISMGVLFSSTWLLLFFFTVVS